ncbi:hypothetical protein [Nitrosospira multiformis]|uniref:hypothetical protein n=1 Tax=Nitrosospira multiformis TaxID=1231 RepID=UPI0008962FE4|nr:hypothetical protein [Nitrosospira multiformis]SEA62903.1 hypothetical protein SAMN05216411_11544 [Nitrosospira multiformis]
MTNQDQLRIQVAKAILSDERGKGYFITEQGLTEFLSIVLEANQEEALTTAREILKDRNSEYRYYYDESSGSETLAGRLTEIGKKLE